NDVVLVEQEVAFVEIGVVGDARLAVLHAEAEVVANGGVEAHRDVLVAGIDDEGLGRRDVHGKSGPDHHRHDSAAKNGGTTNAMFVHRKSLLLMLSDSRAAVPRPDRPFFANRRRLLPGRRNRRTWLISSPW